MKYNMYSVYDEKAKAFLPPFVLPELGMAVRTFGDCINNPQHQFGLHPHDYTLFELATFDDNDGGLTNCNPAVVGNGALYIRDDAPEAQQDLLNPGGTA